MSKNFHETMVFLKLNDIIKLKLNTVTQMTGKIIVEISDKGTKINIQRHYSIVFLVVFVLKSFCYSKTLTKIHT